MQPSVAAGEGGLQFCGLWIVLRLFEDYVVLIVSSGCEFVGSVRSLMAWILICTSKSEAMVLSRKPKNCLLREGYESLAQVKELTFLRVLFTSDGTMEHAEGLENSRSGSGIAVTLPHRCDEEIAESGIVSPIWPGSALKHHS